MSFFKVVTRAGQIIALLILVTGPSLLAAEPASEFVADLLPVPAPIHVTPDVHVPSFDAPRELGPIKAMISPQVWCPSDTLRGKVFDVSEALKQRGFTLPKGSHALYSPEAEILYIDSTMDDVEMARAIFPYEKPPRGFTIDVKAVLKSPSREETLLDLRGVPLLDGQKMEFNTSGHASVHLVMMSGGPIVYLGDTLDIGVDAEVALEGKSVGVVNTWMMHGAKPREAMLGRFGESAVTLSLQIHRRGGRWGDDPESEKENKAAAIKEIQSALEKRVK